MVKRVNLIIILLCLVLYFTNRLVLKQIESIFQSFFICWFDDLLAPVAVLAYINFRFGKQYHLYSILHILFLCSVFCVIWEYGGMLLKKNSVFDYIDIVCYYFGGIIYYLIIKIYHFFEGEKTWRKKSQ